MSSGDILLWSPGPLTAADIGRQVAEVREIDWSWREVPPDTIVADVKTTYPSGSVMVRVASETAGVALWYASSAVNLQRCA